jgi:cytochrome P450
MTADPKAHVPTGPQLTPLDERFKHDPNPVLDDLREHEPVHYDGIFKRYVLTRHDDVRALLHDRSLSVDPRNAAEGTFERMFMAIAGEGGEVGEPSMLFLDPPAHTRLRGLVNKAFTARAVERQAPRIQEIVDELLDAVASEPSFDVIGAFAAPLPTIVIAEMLGVDPAGRADFKRWSDETVKVFNPLLSAEERESAAAAARALSDYFRAAIAHRRAVPGDDLISAMLAVDEDGDRMTEDEIVTMCNLLLTAGNVTTTDLIGNGVLALLQHPEQLQLLRDDPSLIKNAVEEMLRYDSPVTQSGRTPLVDVEIDGCPIAAGQSITPLLSAANHDPAAYPEPHKFDITRADPHHHSFGGGVHYCLGAPLARVEAQIGIGTLVRRFPALRLAGDSLDYKTIPSFRGLATLRVRT